MRRDWEMHSNMYMGVDSRLEANKEIWMGITGFAANAQGFRSRLSTIQAKRLIALSGTKGQTDTKANLRAQLAETADKVGDVLRVIATKANDAELFALAKINPNMIRKQLSDTDAEIRCQQIHAAATAEGRTAALAAEGLDPAEIALLGSRITVYHDVINLPRQKEEDIKAANESLAFLIPDMNKFLINVLDGNVRALPDNPANFAFKQAYKIAREIVGNASGDNEEPPAPPAPPAP